MISSFFGKTKPINYIVLSVFLFLFYGLFLMLNYNLEPDYVSFPLEILVLAVFSLTLFLINQIVKTEKVTEFSSYAMLFFVLLLLAFSETLADKNAIFTNLFLMLALWRLLAIRSIKNVKHKIFDASFLICVASLFYDWALLFLILVFLVINVYDGKTVKNWMVPPVAILAVFVLTFTCTKLLGALDFFQSHYRFQFGFLTDGFFSEKSTTKLIVYSLLVGLLASLVFLKVRKKGGGKLLVLRIVFLAFVLGVVLSFLKAADSGPTLITMFPAAVFFTNFLEGIKKERLKEITIGLCIAIPVLLFVLELNL